MKYAIVYSNKVLREDIPFLDSAVQERAQKDIEMKLAVDPIRFGKPLAHSWKGHRSLRVGDYRVIYQFDAVKGVVYITSIGHRRDIYEH